MNEYTTFKTRTDCFGIPKHLDVEVKYEFDPFDGEICISELILIRVENYNKKGNYEPHNEYLRISDEWLSKQTLEDLATEIHDRLLEDEVENKHDFYHV